MKQLIFYILSQLLYFLLVFTTFYGCELLGSDETKTYPAGTYTRHYKDQYTDSYDTILIEPLSGNLFRVIKKSAYHKINNQNHWYPGSEQKIWQGTYDKQAHMLFLSAAGKTIFFSPKFSELIMGTEPYQKQKL